MEHQRVGTKSIYFLLLRKRAGSERGCVTLGQYSLDCPDTCGAGSFNHLMSPFLNLPTSHAPQFSTSSVLIGCQGSEGMDVI
jgi:hypothetical protein